MKNSKYPEVTVSLINPTDIKKISNEGIVIKRKYGKHQREIVQFTAIDKTEKINL